ncbi:MAG: protein-L-isoaspartate(D-aspartate) O-methyltransferase [Candidatus Hodarchaeales archaeon]|jgi:protein-L-isoaspartate(D-aspartate) O-methyltransferase
MDLQKKKERLAHKFRATKYAINEDIVQAFLKVPREEFVLDKYRGQAYDDHPLPILSSQTISAPHMCVLILSYGRFEPNSSQSVLEIGSGSGYQAALIAELLGDKSHVYSIERLDKVAEFAQKNLERTGYIDRVTVICADGTQGYPDSGVSPFDRIIITAAGPNIPPPLIDQLKIQGGFLYMPLGQPGMVQEWIEVERISKEKIIERSLSTVAFVPLIGEYGIKESQYY